MNSHFGLLENMHWKSGVIRMDRCVPGQFPVTHFQFWNQNNFDFSHYETQDVCMLIPITDELCLHLSVVVDNGVMSSTSCGTLHDE